MIIRQLISNSFHKRANVKFINLLFSVSILAVYELISSSCYFIRLLLFRGIFQLQHFHSFFKTKYLCVFVISELLVSFTSPNDIEIQQSVLKEVSSYCNKPVTDYREDEFVDPYQWTFYHAVFFAFIVCSTLGKLHIFPIHLDKTFNESFFLGVKFRLWKHNTIWNGWTILHDRLCTDWYAC